MKQKIEMTVKNLNAAGIDIGSKSHFVAIGQNAEEIKEFGVYHSDHVAIVKYLKDNNIKTIAMESTGSYWQGLYVVLVEGDFEVLLVPGSQTKGFRKTDVKDARQLQQLHSLGLLSSCFLPDNFTYRVRELSRHRKSMVRDGAKYSNRMQKCLRMMNLRLDVVISDITGVSGLKIIKAILNGERDGKVLASMADCRVKNSKEKIEDALQGNFHVELLYELKDNLELYETIQAKINNLDSQITKLLNEAPEIKNSEVNMDEIQLTKKHVRGKKQTKIPTQKLSYLLYDTDLSAINGVSINTILTIVSELGTSTDKFRNSKAFVSWLRLAPNNKISGGKVLSSRTPKGSNPLTNAFRDAANVIGNQRSGELTIFFKGIAFKKGRCAAITATARKLATIIFNMIKNKEPYNPKKDEVIKNKIEQKKVNNAKKILEKKGFIVIDNHGVMVS